MIKDNEGQTESREEETKQEGRERQEGRETDERGRN